MVDLPPWLQSFLDRLAAEDLSAATRRGYRYDLLQFAAWYTALYGSPPELARLTEHDVIAWRQHMIARRQLKATTINRRLEAVRRLLRWAEATGVVAANVAAGVRTIRLTGDRQPVGLTAAEVHGLLRAAGESSHGLARRNYALVQLMLQTGLRIGEVAALRRADITLRERAGALSASATARASGNARCRSTPPPAGPCVRSSSWIRPPPGRRIRCSARPATSRCRCARSRTRSPAWCAAPA